MEDGAAPSTGSGKGAVIGGAVGGVLGAIAVISGVAAFIVAKKKKRNQALKEAVQARSERKASASVAANGPVSVTAAAASGAQC